MAGLPETSKWFFACALASLLGPGSVCAAATETVLYSFQGGFNAAFPYAGVIEDASGNLYGTTYQGNGAGCGGFGCGTVYKLAPDGTESLLHAFQGGADGAGPHAGLIEDPAGNLYGTTDSGGAANAGTVFEVTPIGTETVLYSFCSLQNCADGGGPIASLLLDQKGNLYGTASYGGSASCDGGCGVVFELAPGGVETVLYAFKGGADGDNPESNLIADASGNLYGTAVGGGGNSPACRKIFQTGGCGIVFEIAPDTSEKILYAFCHKANCKDGASPLRTGLVMDSEANLYGTTGYGGASGRGTVFKLAPDGKETVLHAFKPGPDGLGPVGTLAIDSTGNLYGTTAQGGGGAGCGGQSGCGMVFKISPTGREDRLYSFQIGTDGHSPDTGVILDAAGNLLGTTQEGGDPLCGCGTIFEIVQ